MWRQTLEVARWEFHRFVKPKQLAWSLVLTVLMGLVGYGFKEFAERSGRTSARIAVVGGEALGLAGAGGTAPNGTRHRLTLVPFPAAARDSLRAAVTARALDGLLVLRADGEAAELVVRRDPPWLAELEGRVAAAAQARRLRAVGLAPARLAALLAPPPVTVVRAEPGAGRGARVVALLALGAVVYGVFTGVAYLFVSITGEKQLRVTEQIVSAIPPQAWVDGKLLGIAGVAMVGLLTVAASALLFAVGNAVAAGRWALPSVAAHPGTLALLLLFALLGFAFWFAFFGLVAATIDDPNTSSRGPLMFVPVLCIGAAGLLLRNPDSPFARTLAVLPLTAPGAMPVRLAMGEVAWWEVALSATLLVGGIWLLRRAAGRVFAVAMLLYGKEPSWREVRRWVGRAA